MTDRSNRPAIADLTRTCRAFPTQWDATSCDGTDYYIRFRHGTLTVQRGGPGGEEIHRSEHDMGGELPVGVMQEATGDVLDWGDYETK